MSLQILIDCIGLIEEAFARDYPGMDSSSRIAEGKDMKSDEINERQPVVDNGIYIQGLMVECEVSTETVRKILESKLGELSKKASSPSFIFKAPRELRRVNESAFEQKIISIGPYHHSKPHLEAMENQKLHYLDSIRQQPEGLEHYIAAYMSIEQFVWDSYAKHDLKKRVKFGAIIVLDRLFVVQLFRKVMDPKLREENDALFKQNLNLSIVAQYLLLLENQLPFRVLEMFSNRLGIYGATLRKGALIFFSETEPW
ncbi:UPF0481 protein [Gossypium australe]|uniref:UPF0481 protein n=1 Tax=Gossypium australe TaxID=47621 RepID=A0A5B6VV71_9ROSI|nr:UPF0481 protein [Gossypium australe]